MQAKTLTMLTLATLALGATATAQAGYGGGGPRGGGFTGDLGASGPRLPPPPKFQREISKRKKQ